MLYAALYYVSCQFWYFFCAFSAAECVTVTTHSSNPGTTVPSTESCELLPTQSFVADACDLEPSILIEAQCVSWTADSSYCFILFTVFPWTVHASLSVCLSCNRST